MAEYQARTDLAADPDAVFAPLVQDPGDPLGVLDLATHRVLLAEAPDAYKMFREKSDGCIKVVLEP